MASPRTKPITIVIADQYPIVLCGLRSVIKQHRDLEVVGEAENGREAVALVARLKPDVVITEIAMPRMNGLEATRQILARRAETRVIILSALTLDHQIRDAVRAGVHGFLVKSADIHELPAMVRQVAAGQTSFSPVVARYIQQHGDEDDHASGLTSRELEVLQLVGEGQSAKEISAELNIATKTVETYIASMMGKLDMHDRSSLTRYAINTGVCEGAI